MLQKKILIIGAGASGVFCALQLIEQGIDGSQILILEKGSRPLRKVKVSGGGRCNVTHQELELQEFLEHYPRGRKELKALFIKFSSKEMMNWLKANNVEVHTEKDGRVFPLSNDSQSIIDCFLDKLKSSNVEILYNQNIRKIVKDSEAYTLETDSSNLQCTNLVFATGSSQSAFNHMQKLNLKLKERHPSLFSFKIKNNPFKDLSGLSLNSAKIAFEKFRSQGALLFTHEGISGPAVLKLSSFAAIELAQHEYKFNISIDLVTACNQEKIYQILWEQKNEHSNKKIKNNNPFSEIPSRLWEHILHKVHINPDATNQGLSKKDLQNLSQLLKKYPLEIYGKSTNKEEFVSCGGIDLNEINFKSMESKEHQGLYCIGEALNIDAVTGGFNFQACWSTAHRAAQGISIKLKEA